MSLSMDEIVGRMALPRREVECQALGGAVTLQALSAADTADLMDLAEKKGFGGGWSDDSGLTSDQVRASAAVSAFLIQRMLLAEDGEGGLTRVFAPDDPRLDALPQDVQAELGALCFAFHQDGAAAAGN